MSIRISTGLAQEMMKVGGKSMADAMADGWLEIRSGAQVANADAVETGTQLVKVTLASGAFTPGNVTNGISLGDAVGGVLAKAAGEVWSGLGLADGTAGWWRYHSNADAGGASSTAMRIDGSCGTSGADMIMGNTTISTGGTTTIDNVSITLPKS